MDFRRVFDFLLYFIAMPFVAISFVSTYITNDTRIFIGAAMVADKYYQLPYGWDAAYEVKPIGNRIINWGFYKVADFVIPMIDNNYAAFGFVVKATALVILIICCWYISKRIEFPYAFPILFIAFACQANFGIIMSEWFAALFSMVAIAMCFEKDKNWMVIAGALCLAVGLLKSITVLMVIPTILGFYLLGGTLDWKRFLVGYISAGVAFLIMCLTVWPYSIGDMLMSRLVAHVGGYGFTVLLTFFWITQNRIMWGLPVVLSMYVPILVTGFIIGCYLGIKYFLKSDKREFLFFLGMWVIPIAIVFIQSEFIVYHYIVLVVPALVSTILFLRKNKNWYKAMCATLVFILAGYIMINSVFGSFTLYEYTFWNIKERNADEINSKFNLTNQSSILYLDPGDAVFYFHANSSCHYITPMPVERNNYTWWNITYLPQFHETRDCIVSYQGEYIIADIRNGNKVNYYGGGILEEPTIMNMIEKNYTLVASQSWDIYQKKR